MNRNVTRLVGGGVALAAAAGCYERFQPAWNLTAGAEVHAADRVNDTTFGFLYDTTGAGGQLRYARANTSGTILTTTVVDASFQSPEDPLLTDDLFRKAALAEGDDESHVVRWESAGSAFTLTYTRLPNGGPGADLSLSTCYDPMFRNFDLAVNPAFDVAVVWREVCGGVASHKARVSHSDGVSFGSNVTVPIPAAARLAGAAWGSTWLVVAYDEPVGGVSTYKVLRSSDSGATWTGPTALGSVTGGGSLTQRSELAYDPANDRMFLAAASNDRYGHFRSDDGGVTWLPFEVAHVFAPVDPDHVFAILDLDLEVTPLGLPLLAVQTDGALGGGGAANVYYSEYDGVAYRTARRLNAASNGLVGSFGSLVALTDSVAVGAWTEGTQVRAAKSHYDSPANYGVQAIDETMEVGLDTASFTVQAGNYTAAGATLTATATVRRANGTTLGTFTVLPSTVVASNEVRLADFDLTTGESGIFDVELRVGPPGALVLGDTVRVRLP